ncbi:2-succinyl-5-enolpyruvyl-6-hydroxy-3-cyclohexene-1-carboxylic-acid synthase [Enemella evansiae]|uniref:2-succinyl-5-enolpyruvyl-6-hydroxy-3- cyclohexene-1-carboxylic-acid synthase n=1 Tax=Enemella evansiae TaxID=2016499 RepID=UPI001E373C8A|nr:2-succinyl-5-enolpyruvyl-6-hydroxy-3-cyclohexene-1-carboxylic-acid synthase [Enemella evansiae]
MNAAMRLAETLVRGLETAGSPVVLSPGSRSAPLALALERAARERGLELHVRIDERDAGFLALGLAKASGRMAAVVTTSGTAVGNLQPAVMEAAHSGVPLLVISADRPSWMAHTGANQTTDQAGIFGHFVRASARISNQEGDSDAWAFQFERLLRSSSGVFTRDPGPVHLNVALSEPLISDEDGEAPREGATGDPVESAPGVVETVPYRLSGDRRTVVLAGDATPTMGQRARRLAEQGRLPLLAEPTSNARSGAAVRGYRLLLETPLGKEIERVIVFGHPTLSRPVTRLLRRTDVETVVVTETSRLQVAAPRMRVATKVHCEEPSRDDWLERWTAAGERVSVGIDGLLGDRLTGQTAAAAVVASLGAEDVLVAGSSNPIRDLDLAPVPKNPFLVYANRGLAGIDGTVSTAAGIGLATDEPVTALLGDLTFLHDVGGLLIGPLERRPRLRLVVVNDDGGSIFHSLEQGDEAYATGFERVFGTPTGVRLQPVVEGYGWRYDRAESLVELNKLLAEPVVGQEVIEVPVGRQDRRAMDQQLRKLGLTPS